MNHNYQFLHSVVRSIYTDLPVAKNDAVPSDLMAEVRRYASVFDAQSVGVDESYCYFMIPDTKGTPNLFFAKTARKKNSTSLCYYTQCAGWKFNNVYSLADGDLLPREEFDDIFNFSFYTENEVDAYAESKVPCAFGSGSAAIAAVKPFTIAPKAIQAILHGAISRWYINSGPVYIEVPEGVDYNAYVMYAVKRLYSYFPVAVRTNVGFASYLSPEKASQYPHITLVFVPHSMSNSKTIRLDGSSIVACESMISECSLGGMVNALLEHLAYLADDQERKTFLESVLIDAEYSAAENKIGSIHPLAYAVMGESLRILKLQGSTEEIFPEWLAFAEKQDKYPRGISRQIWTRIDTELTAEKLIQILENGRALAFPTSKDELNAALRKLTRVCHGRAELYSVLWKYTVAVLQNNVLSDPEAFEWLTQHRNDLLRFTDRETYEQFTNVYATRCVEKIRADVENEIRGAKISGRKAYRAMADTAASNAAQEAKKYGDAAHWEAELKKIAEERIAADVAKALNSTENTIRSAQIGNRAEFRRKAENAILEAVLDAGESGDFSARQAELNTLVEERIAADVAKAMDSVEKWIRSSEIGDKAEFRQKVEKAIQEAVRDAGTMDVSARRMELRTLAEARIAECVEKELAQLKRKVLSTADHYKQAIQACQKLFAQLPEAGQFAVSDSVRTNIQTHIEKLDMDRIALMNSVGALIESFEGKYFIAIEKYEAKKQSLTESQKQEAEQELKKLRPRDFHEYCRQFERQKNKKFSAEILVCENSGASKIVVEDMKRLLVRPIAYSIQDRTADAIIEDLDYYISLGLFFGAGGDVYVKVAMPDGSGVEMKAKELRKIISLGLESADAAPDKEKMVYTILDVLRKNGNLGANHEYAMLEMFYRCEYGQAAEKLLNGTNRLDGTTIKNEFSQQFKADAKAKHNKKGKTTTILAGVLAGTTVAGVAAAVVLSVMLGNASKNLDAAKSQAEAYRIEAETYQTQAETHKEEARKLEELYLEQLVKLAEAEKKWLPLLPETSDDTHLREEVPQTLYNYIASME